MTRLTDFLTTRIVQLTSLLLKWPWPPVAISREGLHQHQAWLLEAWFFGKQDLDTQIPLYKNIKHHLFKKKKHQISIEKTQAQRKPETDDSCWDCYCQNFAASQHCGGKASPLLERTLRWFFMTWHKNRPRLDRLSWIYLSKLLHKNLNEIGSMWWILLNLRISHDITWYHNTYHWILYIMKIAWTLI